MKRASDLLSFFGRAATAEPQNGGDKGPLTSRSDVMMAEVVPFEREPLVPLDEAVTALAVQDVEITSVTERNVIDLDQEGSHEEPEAEIEGPPAKKQKTKKGHAHIKHSSNPKFTTAEKRVELLHSLDYRYHSTVAKEYTTVGLAMFKEDLVERKLKRSSSSVSLAVSHFSFLPWILI
jgi:hypothetical protein